MLKNKSNLTSDPKELKNEIKQDIRHSLAISRTTMANERTLLSFTRTALTLIVAGLSFLHFIDDPAIRITALGFIPIGIAVFIFGISRYYWFKKKIKKATVNFERI